MRKSARRGFTIVELVIVIAVIAILAAVLIPTFSSVTSKAKDSAAIQNARNAYTQYLVGNVQTDAKTDDFIYVEDSERIVVIKDGKIVENVYGVREEAIKVATGESDVSNYLVSETSNGKLFAIVKKAVFDNFADSDINVSQTKTLISGDTLEFSLEHKSLKIAELSIPKDAIANQAESVTVEITAINPVSTITVEENTKAYAYDINVTNLKKNLAEEDYVTVTLMTSTALPSVKVYHKGELIQADYNEVYGTVTFKTGSFSPFALSYTEIEVATIEELRAAVAVDNAYIKLTADISAQMNKSIDGHACDVAHSWSHSSYKNTENTYYFLALITGVSVTIDLNGHEIKTIDQLDDGNLWCGSTLTVDYGASLNITDTVGTGKIKAVGPHTIVWAPYADASWCDIYGGSYMSDSYVDDKFGWGYPYNETMIYAGYDDDIVGNINVYGGYYLYNNFPNDNKNNNNGAFNCGDKCTKIGLVIHDGVMLINQYWRQSTGTDDDSVALADGCEVVKVTLDTPIVIDGISYDTWYQVQTEKPEFYTVFENTETYLYRVGNSNTIKLGSLFAHTGTTSSIKENATIEVTIESMDSSTNVAGTYTAASSATDWANGTIKFTGTGVAKITINGCELLVEVVDGKNVTTASELANNTSLVLLNDIALTSSKTSITLGSKALYGNGFAIDYAGYGKHSSNTSGVITVGGGTIDNVRIVGDTYTTFTDTSSDEWYAAAVYATGNSKITNSYIYGCQAALRVQGTSCLVENTTLAGGRYTNLHMKQGTLTLNDVTTVQEKVTVDGTTYLGFGIVVWEDAPAGTTIKTNVNLTQYNWVTESDKSYLPGSAADYVDTAFGYSQFVYSYGGTDYVNLGIISISSNVMSSNIGVPTGYSAQDVGTKASVVTCDNTKNSTALANGVPTYVGWDATAQGKIAPAYTWSYPSEYNSSSNTISTSFEEGSSYTLDPNILTATKNGANLSVSVSMDGTDYTGKSITFAETGDYTLTYTVTDPI